MQCGSNILLITKFHIISYKDIIRYIPSNSTLPGFDSTGPFDSHEDAEVVGLEAVGLPQRESPDLNFGHVGSGQMSTASKKIRCLHC